MLQISRKLRSFYSGAFGRVGREYTLLEQTSNLETSGGYLYLLHKDEKVVQQDLKLLHLLEMQFSQMLFNESSKISAKPKGETDITDIMKKMRFMGSTLVFSDTLHEVEGAILVNRNTMRDSYDGFDQGILDLRDPASFADLESIVQQIMLFFRKIRRGGQIVVPATTYCHLPYGMDGIEILMKVAGLVIESPEPSSACVVVASVPV